MYGWGVLMVAIAFEIAGTTFMKLSEGFTRTGPSVALFACYGVSFAALTMALRYVDIGVAYAIWSGVGTAAIAAIGMMAFDEPFTAARVFWIGVIVVGVVGLQVSSTS